MKKIFISTYSLFTYLTLALPAHAQAQMLCNKDGMFGALCDPRIENVIPGFINFLFIMAVIVALIYLIWGGFKWLMSGGDKTGVQTAREHIVAAIVGLVIIFLSYFILNLVIGFFLPDFNLTNFPLPTITDPNPTP